MFYRQTSKDVKLVIMAFDDVMFDLTKMRFNYYRRLCRLYNVTLDREEFFNHVGSARGMFANSPIDQALLSKEALIGKIEEDLLAYCQMEGMRHRDGLVELMELFRQKKLPCAVTSTHEKKYTEPLLETAALYHQPDTVFYDEPDTPYPPDPGLYQKILNHYGLKPEEALLIAGNRQAVYAANKLRMNVVFLPGLEPSSVEMEIRCMKIVPSLLDVINVILEKGRPGTLDEQYLLIRHDGSTQDLYANYQYLVERNRKKPEVISEIEKIYQDEFSQAQKRNVEATIKKAEMAEHQPKPTPEQTQSVLNRLETVLQDSTGKISELLNEEIDQSEPPQKAPEDDYLQEVMKDLNESPAPQKRSEARQEKQEPVEEIHEDSTRTRVFTKEELKMFGMHESDLNEEEEADEEDIEEEEKTAQPWLIVSWLVNIGYALIDGILLTLLGGIMMVGFADWINNPASPFYFVHRAFVFIGDTSVMLFGSLLHPLQELFHTSEMFTGTLAVMLLLSIVIWIILDIVSLVKKLRHQ